MGTASLDSPHSPRHSLDESSSSHAVALIMVRRSYRSALALLISALAVAKEYSLDDPDADHRGHAIELDEAGDIAGAIASFRAMAKFHPTQSEHWNNLGIALKDEENPQMKRGLGAARVATLREAAVAFKRAQIADPKNDWADENRAELLNPEAGLVTQAGVFSVGDGKLDALIVEEDTKNDEL